MKRKVVRMVLAVSVPGDRSAAWARKEVRHLIKGGVGYYTNAGDDDGVKLLAIAPGARA